MICPLCKNKDLTLYCESLSYKKTMESFYSCQSCGLISKNQDMILSSQEESKRYQEHNNDPTDPGYQNFLLKAVNPLHQRLPSRSTGLDFGCGPGPTVSILMKELGHNVFNYDPYFFPDQTLLETKYDFVISTEVFEHMSSPHNELIKIKSMLKDNGLLCIMTQIYDESIDFSSWWYKNDPTHIVFYQESTFEWIASYFELSLIYLENNIVIFKNEK